MEENPLKTWMNPLPERVNITVPLLVPIVEFSLYENTLGWRKNIQLFVSFDNTFFK